MSQSQLTHDRLHSDPRELVPYDAAAGSTRERTRRRRVALFRIDQVLNAALIGGLLLAIVIGVTTRPGSDPQAANTPADAAAPTAPGRFTTAQVSRGALLVRVAATGTVEPVRLVEVSTEISGTIRAVHVENNDVVRAGQLLAELDSETLDIELSKVAAQVASARAKLREAEAFTGATQRELERKSELARRDLTPQRDLDQARANRDRKRAEIEGLRAELTSAEAAQRIAQFNRRRARVVSPIDGVVLRRNIEPGQTVAASLQAPVLFRLAQSLERMQIRVDIDEADALQVRGGQPATFSVQALRDRQIPARVEKIFVGPEIVQGVVTYKALLSFDNATLDLRPGMTASAEIIVERITDGLLVPNAALRFSPPDALPASRGATGIGLVDTLVGPATSARAGPRPTPAGPGPRESARVFVESSGQLVAVPLEIGASDGVMTHVVSGSLRPGQRVVVDLAPTSP